MSNAVLQEHALNIWKNDMEVVWDGVHCKMKFEAAFRGILKISKYLKISLNVHAKLLRSVCEEI